jgi:serine/threonine protein kinase
MAGGVEESSDEFVSGAWKAAKREAERRSYPEQAQTQVGPVDRTSSIELDMSEELLPPGSSDRYEQQGHLGAGGMGEVALCLDHAIGRQVAMKVAHEELHDRGDVLARFLLEARVQAQLEHPSIVPVYDVGQASEGVPFFTMRRVKGRTLEQVIAARRSGDPEEAERFGERRLLSAFGQLCLALDFVHERGVVHRDLKPSNVMFGEYGEVYLLDWGLAKVLGTAEDEPRDGAIDPRAKLQDSAPDTHFGTIMGTPGYVAPELVGAEPVLTTKADIYGLGALLFELLTGEPLHVGESVLSLIHSTEAPVTERVRNAAYPLAPELEELVLWATELDPGRRCPSARALHDGIERYLDGHRDSERRRQQADALVAEVRDKAEGETLDPEATRRRALAKLGRALALDPDHRGALEGLVGLLTDPPRTLPDEVRAELEEQEARQTRQAGKIGAAVFLGLNLFVPLVLLTGLRTWIPVILFSTLTTLTGLASWLVSRLDRPSTRSASLVFTLALATAASTSALVGPFLIAPLIIVVVTLLFTLNHPPQYRKPFVVMGLLAVLIPITLEWTGAVPPSMSFGPEGLQILPRSSDLAPIPTLALLTIVSLATIVIAGGAIGPIRKELDQVQARIRLQAWQLKQMVPAPSDEKESDGAPKANDE